MIKALCCKYDETFDLENSTGALRIYLPTQIGYINYNIAHAVHEEIVCDTWRTSYAFACDDALENAYPLNPGAEWDMALRIRGRDDFIGGQAHGDEIYTSLKLWIDGVEKEITSLIDRTPCAELHLQVESVGYDPADHKTPALNHFKEYIITSEGVAIEQRVAWLNDYRLDKCYMAMMPPLKAFVDSYYTDADPTVRKITTGGFRVDNCASATLFGTDSKLLFHMSVPKYPSYETGNQLLISDNNGRPYHKMYFPVCTDARVKRGEVWETRTQYTIRNG